DIHEGDALRVEESAVLVHLNAVDENLCELLFAAAQSNHGWPERPIGFVDVDARGIPELIDRETQRLGFDEARWNRRERDAEQTRARRVETSRYDDRRQRPRTARDRVTRSGVRALSKRARRHEQKRERESGTAG